jgi:hypothetical protein
MGKVYLSGLVCLLSSLGKKDSGTKKSLRANLMRSERWQPLGQCPLKNTSVKADDQRLSGPRVKVTQESRIIQ